MTRLKTPLKVLGHLKMGFQPGDRENIVDSSCPLCVEGIVGEVGGEIICVSCMVSFVEHETPASEFAYKDNVRNAHSRPYR